jgi:hypothetical protein
MRERADEALEHLQSAAHELIAAARAFLDLAEEVVDDPKAGEALIDTLGGLARKARSAADGDGPTEGGVEHIEVD